MKNELLKRVRKVEVYYLDGYKTPDARDFSTKMSESLSSPDRGPITGPAADYLDTREVPSEMIEGLYYLPARLTVRYGEVVSKKCKPLQFQLLWHLDRFGGTADLEAAATECLGKEIGEDLELESMKRNFYKIGDIFVELSIPASIAVSIERDESDTAIGTARINR